MIIYHIIFQFMFRTATTRFRLHYAHPIRGTLGNLPFWIRNSPAAWMTLGWIPELQGMNK